MNVVNLQANDAVTILESASTDDETEAMVKIANLTVNSLTGSFDDEFLTNNETMLSSTVLCADGRRHTRAQQFYQDARIIPQSTQQHTSSSTQNAVFIAIIPLSTRSLAINYKWLMWCMRRHHPNKMWHIL